MTGLHADSEQVMAITVAAVDDFLKGKGHKIKQRARYLGKQETQELESALAEAKQSHKEHENSDMAQIIKVGPEGGLVHHPVGGGSNGSTGLPV